MSQIQVQSTPDHIKQIASANPFKALGELIWNGFDAGANSVHVEFELNALGTVDRIIVRDDGEGIPHHEAEVLFGQLGNSWKKNAKGIRSLHGRSGQGRFKAYSLGGLVEWRTAYRTTEQIKQYKIFGSSKSADAFSITEPELIEGNTYTEVQIANLTKDFANLIEDTAEVKLSEQFAVYLTENPRLSLIYNRLRVDPTKFQVHRSDVGINAVVLPSGITIDAQVTIIEWDIPSERLLHLCDESGVSLSEHKFGQGVRAKGQNFTAYIKSKYIRTLAMDGQLIVGELNPDVESIFELARDAVNEHFAKRTLEIQAGTVSRWRSENIYPFDSDAAINPVEYAERQVFDILAVNVERSLTSFAKFDLKAKKFTFKLLSQAIKENPVSVQKIIVDVLGLKRESQDDLANLLERTPLSSVISSAKTVADRLDFLNGLHELLFNPKTKKTLLEKSQLHPLLEREAWIFNEEFTLAGSEERLEKVLDQYAHMLGDRADKATKKGSRLEKAWRTDLRLQKALELRPGEFDFLVVELKRPSQLIDSKVITQVKNYAVEVASDSRFRNVRTKWTFLAISNDLDKFAKKEVKQRNRVPGCVYDDEELNITVWVKTWSEIINESRSKLNFINKSLSYVASDDTSKEYLQRTHAKFIPELDLEFLEAPEENTDADHL